MALKCAIIHRLEACLEDWRDTCSLNYSLTDRSRHKTYLFFMTDYCTISMDKSEFDFRCVLYKKKLKDLCQGPRLVILSHGFY